MKKLLLITLILLISITGCKENTKYKKVLPTESRFLIVEQINYLHADYLDIIFIIVDKETRIMYLYTYTTDADGIGTTMTIMLDKDGKPLRYTGEIYAD